MDFVESLLYCSPKITFSKLFKALSVKYDGVPSFSVLNSYSENPLQNSVIVLIQEMNSRSRSSYGSICLIA